MTTTAPRPRYWCHVCQTEVQAILAPDPTCLQCNGQFVEQIEETNDPRNFYTAQGGGNLEDGTDEDGNDTQVSEMLQTILQSFVPNGRVTVQSSTANIDTPVPPNYVETSRETNNQASGDESSDSEEDNGENRQEGQDTVRIMQLMNIIQQILSRAEGNNTEPLELFPMSGNMDDYVFTQNGLDDVITQLLEQATNRNAPPPASEEIIAKLKRRKTTAKDTEDNQDCSVCKEDFSVSEDVLILPCEHFFHQECIKQWLLVNGTCPICRYSLTTAPTESATPPNEQIPETDTDSSNHVQSTNNAGRTEGTWTSLIPGIFRWTRPSSPFPRRTAGHNDDNDQEEDDNMDALD
ncbi:hypothetical protein BC943DRAFT_320213 [Umbelopsis sp. AD052]|nr:hypothetical protein BC943DRAFT_320213 [Umbelopsis sp. AD052]